MANSKWIHGFGRDQSGSAAVEYAAMLALILAMALVAIDALGLAGKYSFLNVSNALATNGHTAARPRTQSDHPIESEEPTESASVLHRVPWGHVLLASALVLGVGVNWKLSRHLRRARKAIADSQAAGEERDQAKFLQKRQQILRTLGFDISRLLESRVEVRHVMTERVRTVTPLTPVAVVAEQMADLQSHHLLVCDEDGMLLGVISDRDLRSRTGLTAQEVMTRAPITATPDTLLIPAASAMLERNISCLPVVKDDRLCGVLTKTDLIMTLQCCLQALHQMLGWLVPKHDENEVRGAVAVERAHRSVTISEMCRASDN